MNAAGDIGAPLGQWRPTAAHVRAVVMAVACFTGAVVWRRADLAILGVPFAGLAAWGAAHRPRRAVVATLDVEARTMFEGQASPARVTVTTAGDQGAPVDADIVAGALATGAWLVPDPTSAARAVLVEDGRAEVVVTLQAVRWGRHEVGLDTVACTSRLGAYRSVGVRTMPVLITTMPQSAEFDAADAMPRPGGLVGLHQSRRLGSGSEPAEVRPFRPGDRLRRINWSVSSRTGELHVTSTWADRDAHVLLLLDSEYDVGLSDGIAGRASSLDVAVRAAAALGEHYLRAGDRVALADLGRRVRDVPAGSGGRHLRRLLEVLVSAEPGVDHRADAVRARPITGGALVIALTPLIGRSTLDHVAHLALHGHSVVVVDTRPTDAGAGSGDSIDTAGRDAWAAPLAVRLRAMERAAEIDRLGELGVPVVAWRGRGTLDEVLRGVSRMGGTPHSGGRRS